MPSSDIYAKCDFTRTGRHEPWFVVVIKVPKAELEALRQERENRGLEDKVILGKFSGQVATVLYPHPDATFSTGCKLYPEGEIPTEIERRPPDGNLPDLSFWNVVRRYRMKIQSRTLNDDGTMTMIVVSEILESQPDLPPFTTDPDLDIKRCAVSFENQRLYLTLVLGAWPPNDLVEGRALAIIVGE